MAKATKKQETTLVVIPPMERAVVPVTIRGTSILVQHRYDEKTKLQMLEAMQGKKTPKTPKDPEKEFNLARYVMADGNGDGFKANTVRLAMIRVSKQLGLKMTDMRGLFYVEGNGLSECGEQCVRILDEKGRRPAKPVMREDYVRVGAGGKGGGNDLRYRPMYFPWSATFNIRFDHQLIDVSSVLELVNRAGYCNGIGENRMEKGGEGWGAFEVVATAKRKKGRKAA
jgi:hypothetical protein